MIAKRPWLIAVISVSVMAVGWAIFRTKGNSSESKPDLAVVMVSKVQPAELYEELTYPARISAKINTDVLSEVDGVVSKIHAPLGERVSRGQLLMTMTHTDPVYQYAPVQVLSPVNGVVSSVEVTDGTQVLKGSKLISVTNPAQMRIQIEIPAADLSALKARQTGELKIPGKADPIAVTVHGISPFVDPSTGTASAELDFAPKAGTTLAGLAPGMLGLVSFKTGLHTGFSVPDFAVVYRGTNTFLRLVEDGKLRSIPVTLGKRERGSVEVLTGLSPNLTIVQRASRYIADGDKVTIQ